MKVNSKPKNGRKPKCWTDRFSSSHDAFIERVRAMSSRERVEYMISAGINTEDGKLTKQYRD